MPGIATLDCFNSTFFFFRRIPLNSRCGRKGNSQTVLIWSPTNPAGTERRLIGPTSNIVRCTIRMFCNACANPSASLIMSISKQLLGRRLVRVEVCDVFLDYRRVWTKTLCIQALGLRAKDRLPHPNRF